MLAALPGTVPAGAVCWAVRRSRTTCYTGCRVQPKNMHTHPWLQAALHVWKAGVDMGVPVLWPALSSVVVVFPPVLPRMTQALPGRFVCAAAVWPGYVLHRMQVLHAATQQHHDQSGPGFGHATRSAALLPLVLPSNIAACAVLCVLCINAWCRPDLLLVERSVARSAQEELLARGISLVQHAKPELLERLGRCMGVKVGGTGSKGGCAWEFW